MTAAGQQLQGAGEGQAGHRQAGGRRSNAAGMVALEWTGSIFVIATGFVRAGVRASWSEI